MALTDSEQQRFTPSDLRQKALFVEKEALLHEINGELEAACISYHRAAALEHRAFAVLSDSEPTPTLDVDRGISALRIISLLSKSGDTGMLGQVFDQLHGDTTLPAGIRLEMLNLAGPLISNPKS